MAEKFEELEREIMKEVASCVDIPAYCLHGEEVQQLLRVIFDVLESRIKLLAKNHSKELLLGYLRTLIPPSCLAAVTDKPSLNMNPIRIATLAALKYGNSSLEVGLPMSGRYKLSSNEKEDAINIAFLAQLYSYYSKIWYGTWLGTTLEVTNERLHFEVSPEIRILMDIDDDRHVNEGLNYLAPASGIDNIDIEKLPDLRRPPWVLQALCTYPSKENEAQTDFSLGPMFHDLRSSDMEYLGIPHSIHSWQILASTYSNHIVSTFKMSVAEISAMLTSLSFLHGDGCMNQGEYFKDFCKTGLSLFDVDTLYQYLHEPLINNIKEMGLQLSERALYRRFFNAMVLNEKQYEALDLHMGLFQTCFYRFENRLFVDWLFIDMMLNSLLLGVSMSSEMRDIKGRAFERDLDHWLNDQLLDLKRVWKPNIKLKKSDRVLAEIDLSYSRGPLAFIIDCKAYTVNTELLRGDYRAVQNRYNYVEDWLSQVTKACRTIVSNPVGDNYQLKPDVDYLVPLVCSTNIEPLYPFDERHFVVDSFPHVCTPSELVDILTGKIEIPLDSECVFKVQR